MNREVCHEHAKQNCIECEPRQQEGQAHSRKIVCHAEGDRCFGCAHYLGKADECEFKGLEQGITISKGCEARIITM